MAGIRAPRDAAQQAEWGEAVELDPGAWAVGDLLCFGQPADHVALWDGAALVHARARVRRERPAAVPELMERLTTVRRPGPSQAITRPSLWGTVPRPKGT
jgi:cell wall-associated NlpC family hydrolase